MGSHVLEVVALRSHSVACRPNGISQVYEGIPVAVGEDPCDLDVVSRGLALAPPIPPRAAVEGCKPALICLLTCPRCLRRCVDGLPPLGRCFSGSCQYPYLVCNVSLIAFLSAYACMRTSPVSTCCRQHARRQQWQGSWWSTVHWCEGEMLTCTTTATKPFASHFRLSKK